MRTTVIMSETALNADNRGSALTALRTWKEYVAMIT